MDKVAVLIPCYNEAPTISKVVKDWKKALPKAEIYVYDNNSSDDTVKLAKQAGAIVRYEFKQGKGNVVRRMFREVEADCYIMVDGDDTYPATRAQDLVAAVIKKNADMVVGDRLSSTYFSENKRRFHNTGNSSVRWIINTLFNGDIKDIMTGCRAFSRQFVKNFPILSKGFEIETEMSIWALDKNLSIVNIPVDYRDRPDGSESKLKTYSDGIKVIFMIVRLFKNYKPFFFFGIIALFSFIIAFLFFIPIFINYIHTGLVPNFPTLIVCGFAIMAAIQSFFTGLILETIHQKNCQEFEYQLLRMNNDRKK